MIEQSFDTRGNVAMDRVADRWGNLTASRLEFLSEVAALDRERGFDYDGYTSTAAFLMHRCGMSARRARREVFLARSLDQMRLTWSAVASGTLSFDQAVVLLTTRGWAAEEGTLLTLTAEGQAIARRSRAARHRGRQFQGPR